MISCVFGVLNITSFKDIHPIDCTIQIIGPQIYSSITD